MASVDATMKVSVETAIHDALKNILQDIEETYGLHVEQMDVDWMDTSSVGQRSSAVQSIRLVTRK